jgi:lipase chaperone LimK
MADFNAYSLGSRSPIVRLGGLILTLVLAVWIWQWWDSPTSSAQHGSDGVRFAPGAFARSLQGTVPDGNLPAIGMQANMYSDAFKNGMPYADLRRFFDYYLSTMGEQDETAITRQIIAEIKHYLPPHLAEKVQALFMKYLAYGHASTFKPDLSALSMDEVARKFFQFNQNLRERYFTAQEREGLFSEDMAYEKNLLSHIEINSNPNYSAQKKAELLAAADAAMPAPFREAAQAPRAVILTEDAVQQLRQNGGSEAEVFALRAKAFTPEAAGRLAAVDNEEAAWQSRIADYRNHRQKIVDQAPTLETASEKQAALLRLQKDLFRAEELPRLVAYE